MMPAVPIVIPVFARDDVFETVRFLRSQDYAAKLRFVIIDNGNDAELSSRFQRQSGDPAEMKGGFADLIEIWRDRR